MGFGDGRCFGLLLLFLENEQEHQNDHGNHNDDNYGKDKDAEPIISIIGGAISIALVLDNVVDIE